MPEQPHFTLNREAEVRQIMLILELVSISMKEMVGI
jgi:hypothetical protein